MNPQYEITKFAVEMLLKHDPESLKLKNVKTGEEFKITNFNDEGNFYIKGVDPDGLETRVDWHQENCGCDKEHTYVLPASVATKLDEVDRLRNRLIDYVMINSHIALYDPDIRGGELENNELIGEFVCIKSEHLEPLNGHVTIDSLVFVTGITINDKTGVASLVGYTTFRGKIITIVDERWRYRKFDTNFFNNNQVWFT